MKDRFDLLVLGAGMAGLSAAAWVTTHGGNALVIDKSDTPGGSTLFAGIVWTAPSFEIMRTENPGGNPDLAEAITGDVGSAVEWLKSLGVACGPPMELMRFGLGRRVDTNQHVKICTDLVRSSPGSEVWLQARPVRLLTEAGSVVGAEILLASGKRVEVIARSTLLATGGFQGDAELRAQLIHPQAKDIPLRANRSSTGDGMRLGIDAGASFGHEQAGFYGHLIPSGIAYEDPTRFTELTMYCSEHAILVNLLGERFCDETYGDHLNAIAVLEQPEARALMISDQRIHDQWMVTAFVPGTPPLDKFDIAYRAGGRCARAASLDDFTYLPDEWGYPAAGVVAAVSHFQQQMVRGSPQPGRQYDLDGFGTSPFYVIEVRPAITFSYGGILIDDQARAVDGDGQPVAGLLAAGADAGGIYFRSYAGGLASALVMGLRAGRTAMEASRDT